MKALKFLHYILTDENNQWDIGILVWLAGCITFIYRGWSSPLFDFQSFGLGLAGVLGGGAGLKWVRDRNPKPELPMDEAGTAIGPTATVKTTSGVSTQPTSEEI